MKSATPKKKRKLNVRLLRKIQRHILEEPRRFFMSWWVVRTSSGNWPKSSFSDLAKSPPPCGTAACIAGTANLLTNGKNLYASTRARIKLGLTTNQAQHLFARQLWPEPFTSRYENAKTPKTRAKIACARIDHLIATGE